MEFTKLLTKLERYRAQLHLEIKTKGMHNEDVIKISQKIDQLHNEFNRLKYNDAKIKKAL